MNELLELWNAYCDYFNREWPFSLMWTVAVLFGFVVLWRMLKENGFPDIN